MIELSELEKVLMERDDLTVQEVKELVQECKDQIRDGEDPEDVLHELGLEPDYIIDLL